MHRFLMEFLKEYIELREYDIDEAQMRKIIDNLLYEDKIIENDLNQFLGSVEDGIEDTIDNLDYERYPMSEEEEELVDDFFSKGAFVRSPDQQGTEGYTAFLWEDFSAAQTEREDQGLHIYTLVEEEGRGYITPGARLINRFAYLLSTKDAGLDKDEYVRFW